MAQGNKAVDTELWKTLYRTAPTGISVALTNVFQRVLPNERVSLDPQRSPTEVSAELLAQAARAYYQLRDKARSEFEASGSLQVLLDFVNGEPYTLHDLWVREVLVQRLRDWDQAAVKSIVSALKPRKPKLPKNGSPQEAEAYYRWVVAKVSEKILSGEAQTVIQAIVQVAFSDEGVAKRAAAGMPEAGDDRVRQIYYQEADRYARRVMVMAGLGLVEKPIPTESRQDSAFQRKL
jgi:hypothetical protein